MKTVSWMVMAISYLSIMTLNINGLNYTIKREWLKRLKKKIQTYKRFNIYLRKHIRQNVNFHANINSKTAEVIIFISDQINFKSNTVIREKESHYKMKNRSIQQ
jgi:hypothetical protein